MKKNLIIIDNDQKSLSALCQAAKKMGFGSLPFNDANRVLRALTHCADVVAVVCNLKDESIPSQNFVETLKKHKIPLTIFSDIPGISYVNNHFFTGVQFFKGPANNILLKFCLNDFLPSETPKDNPPVKKKILQQLLKNMDFSSVISQSRSQQKKNRP